MSYKINTTDPFNGFTVSVSDFTSNGPIHPTSSILESTAISAKTSLLFYGRGHPSYGERMAENVLHILENFSGASEPKQAVNGQVWACRYDYINANGNWFEWNHNTLIWDAITINVGIPTVLVGFDGDFWLDGMVLSRIIDKPSNPLTPSTLELKYTETTTFSDPNTAGHKPFVEIKVYNNGSWIGSSDVVYSSISPTAPQTGKLWFDTNTSILKIFDGATFNSILSGFVQTSGDTMTGVLDMNGNDISNLPIPTADTNPATKKYVDDAITIITPSNVSINDLADVNTGSANATNTHLKWDGAEWNSTPINLIDVQDVAATGVSVIQLSYIASVTSDVQVQIDNTNSVIIGKVSKAGDLMTGDLNMGSNLLIQSQLPSLPTHATNKSYVDSEITNVTDLNRMIMGQFQGTGFSVAVSGTPTLLVDPTALVPTATNVDSLAVVAAGVIDLSLSTLLGSTVVADVTITVVWNVPTAATGIRKIELSTDTNFSDTKSAVTGQELTQVIATGPIEMNGSSTIGVNVQHGEAAAETIKFFNISVKILDRG